MERRDFLKWGLAGIGAAALADSSRALEYFPRSSDKKWAILYSTWCGSSRDAAIWISEGMGGIADVFDLREKPDLKAYDHIVVGSSIRSWKIAPALADYLEKNKGWLKDKIRGFYAICGNMRRPIQEEQRKAYIDDQLTKITGVSNVPGKVFLGRVTRALLDPQSIQMFDRMNMPDYDKMVRTDFLAFGKEILENTARIDG